MGVGFGASGPVPSRNGKRLSKADLFSEIRKAVEDSCDDPFLARMIDFGDSEVEHEYAVVLYPGAEAVFFSWDPAGTVFASCKTSTAGPGYHVYAIDVVKRVGEKCGIAWVWEDEAEYAPDGDVAVVKEHMRAFLRALAGSFLKDQERDFTMAVNMDMFAPTPADNQVFSITPLGPRDRTWWEAAMRAEDTDTFAKEFYPWWDVERDAAFYLNTGLLLLWTKIKWFPPMSEAEEAEMQLALECLERAEEMGAKVPREEMEEIRALMELEDDDEEVPEPVMGRIGYYRAVISRRLPGGWTVKLPGYWGESYDEETGCVTIFFNERAVHITTYGFDPHPGKPPPDPDEVASFPDEIPQGAEKVKFKVDGVVGRGIITETEEDGEEGIILQGTAATSKSFAHITVWYKEEKDRKWAKQVFESLSGPTEGD